MDFLGFDKPPRPKKRHQPLDTTYIFQLRVDFVAAQPPLWRRFEIRSDASLWTLHRVLQGALDWYDGHLYRFALVSRARNSLPNCRMEYGESW